MTIGEEVHFAERRRAELFKYFGSFNMARGRHHGSPRQKYN